MKDLVRFPLILLIVCGLAAGSLAFVNAATKDQIAEYARLEKLDALKRVFPSADDFKETEPGKRWDAMKGADKLGTVFLASTMGYSGTIEVIFGMDVAGAMTGARVIAQTETPGLGAKIATDKFLGQYAGKAREQVALKKDDPAKGQIDAISAATISSRAVTRAIRAAIDSAAGGQ